MFQKIAGQLTIAASVLLLSPGVSHAFSYLFVSVYDSARFTNPMRLCAVVQLH